MSKQDRQGARTPADLERKYRLNNTNAPFREVERRSMALEEVEKKYESIEDHIRIEKDGVTFVTAVIPLSLPEEADIDSIVKPNRYLGKSYMLEVELCGTSGVVKQRRCEASGETFERIKTNGTWGEWVRVSDYVGTLLWSGGTTMSADTVITLTEPVSKQRNGIVLVFSEYSEGETLDTALQHFFVPKYTVSALSDKWHSFFLITPKAEYCGIKNIRINSMTLTGAAENQSTATADSGIIYHNEHFVLRYVIGV